MDMIITPSRLLGCIPAMPSKSHLHRALFACALSNRPSVIRVRRRFSQDVYATIAALTALGARFDVGECIRVTPSAQVPSSPAIDCRESATTARFVLPLASHLAGEYTLTGCGTLPNRPVKPLLDALRANGCAFDANTLQNCASGRLTPGIFRIPGDISSQFVSGLLLTLPILHGDSEIIVDGVIESAGYIDMTLNTLRTFGISIDLHLKVTGNQRYMSPGEVEIEGDWSLAAPFLCMGGRVSGLNTDSLQGDRRIVQLLRDRPEHIDVSQTPDLATVIAAAACGLKRTTVIFGGKRLIFKESDRTASTANMLRTLGGDVTQTSDGMIIRGTGALNGGCVNAASDHRIVMAAAVAASVCLSPVIIRGAEAVNKSYPEFFDDYRILGGRADVV